MGQQQLLRLARIDVGAAGDVHVRSAPGDVEAALRVETTEGAGVEPDVLQRLGIGLGIVVVSGTDGGAAHADLALPACRPAVGGWVLDGDTTAVAGTTADRASQKRKRGG